jgi:hypothetical protein
MLDVTEYCTIAYVTLWDVRSNFVTIKCVIIDRLAIFNIKYQMRRINWISDNMFKTCLLIRNNWNTLKRREEKMTVFERGDTRSTSVEEWLYKGLRTGRETHSDVNDFLQVMTSAFTYNLRLSVPNLTHSGLIAPYLSPSNRQPNKNTGKVTNLLSLHSKTIMF